MMASPRGAGLLALPGAMCGEKTAEAPCSRAASQTSSGSGWSSGTHAQAVEQQAWSDGLYSLPSQGEHSIKSLPAQQAAAPSDQQHRQLAAATACIQQQQQGGQQQGAWPACVLSPAGPTLVQGEAPTPLCWQHSSTSTFGSLHLQQQPEAAVAAATAAASPDIDPWSSGLELVAAAPPAVEPATAPLALTDAGLEALLAPFEDWPYLLQPAGSAVQAMPATLLQAPAACAAAQLPQQQQQQQACAAAAHSPRSSSGSDGPPAGCCTCTCGAAAGAGGAAAAAKAAPAKLPRRRGGRPRVYHHRSTSAGSAAGEVSAADGTGAGGGTASVAAGAPPPAGQPFKKSGRGPKPKYVFSTQEEAADARRERNRKAALDSYYRKKKHTERLQRQVSDLQEENAALQQLLGEMAASGLCPLLEASNQGIDLWLAQRKQAAQEADAVADPMPL